MNSSPRLLLPLALSLCLVACQQKKEESPTTPGQKVEQHIDHAGATAGKAVDTATAQAKEAAEHARSEAGKTLEKVDNALEEAKKNSAEVLRQAADNLEKVPGTPIADDEMDDAVTDEGTE